MSNHNRKTNRFLLLVLLITAAFLSAGASSWLIINEQSGNANFKAYEPITPTIYVDSTSVKYAGETIQASSTIPGVFKCGDEELGKVTTASSNPARVNIKVPSYVNGSSAELTASVTFVPDADYMNENNYKVEDETLLTKTAKVKAVMWDGSSAYYSSIDHALNTVKSGNIFVYESFANYRTYKEYTDTATTAQANEYKSLSALSIKSSKTIPSGVTLIIPCSSNVSDTASYLKDITTDVDGKDEAYAKPAYLTYNITLSAGVTLTNNGTLNIGGVIGGGGGGHSYASLTSDNYGQLTLNGNSTLANNGAVECYGFIDESSRANGSKFNNNSGATLKMPFTIFEHRGGTAFVGLANLGLGAIGGLAGQTIKTNYDSCPFNRFFLGNVTSTINFNYNSKMLGFAGVNVDGIADSYINIVGSDDTYLLNLTNSNTKFKTKFNPDNKISKWDIYGNLTLNYLDVTLTMMKMTALISSEKILFPITWLYDIELHKYQNGAEATITINQDLKIMPGGTFTIDQGVTVNATKIAVYNSDFTSDSVNNVGTHKYTNGNATAKPEGYLNVNGTLNLTALGGYISTQSVGASVKFGTATVSTLEIINNDTYTSSWNYSARGSICYSGDANMSAGTYYSDGSQWYALGNKTITYNSNGGSTIASKTVNATNTDGTGYKLTEEDLTAPTKAHYTFAGWYRDSSLTQKVEVGSAVCGDITLYAKWVANTYNIAYNTTCVINGTTLNGTANNTLSSFTCETANEAFNDAILPDDVKADYLFDGWYIDSSYNTRVETIKDLLSHVSTNGQTITLYAKWIELVTVYNITYNYDNYPAGVDKPTGWPETATVNGNATGFNSSPTTLPKDSLNTNIGYSQYFAGWYADSAFTTPVTTWGSLIPEDSEILDWTVYAKFDTKYKLTFKSDYPGDTAKSVDATYSHVWWLSPDELATRKPTVAEVLSASEIALLDDLDGVLTEQYYYGGEWALTDGLTPFSSLTESNFTNKELTLNVLWKKKTVITLSATAKKVGVSILSKNYTAGVTVTLNGKSVDATSTDASKTITAECYIKPGDSFNIATEFEGAGSWGAPTGQLIVNGTTQSSNAGGTFTASGTSMTVTVKFK